MVQPSLSKALWWILFAGDAGGLAVFLYLCCMWGPPPPGAWYLWPAITTPLAFISARRLRQHYREEAAAAPGRWQLSLSDLLVVSFFIGLLFAAFQAFWPARFVRSGVPASLLTGVAVIFGILVARRRGITDWMRYVFAVGHVLRLYGAIGVGGAATMVIVSLLVEGHPLHWLGRSGAAGVLLPGFLCLPLGHGMCYVARKSSLPE